MTASAYPLAWPHGWPRTARWQRKRWRHQSKPFNQIREGIRSEVQKLGGSSLVISTNLQLRLDGEPRADAARMVIDDPGVAIYFQLRGRPMVMARDVYDLTADNLNSIRLAVEYMRGLERHGGAHMMERAFAGFTALPPPEGGSADTRPVIWRDELAPIPLGLSPADTLLLAEARYREKAKAAHSDVGGSDAAMIRLNVAIGAARQELKS